MAMFPPSRSVWPHLVRRVSPASLLLLGIAATSALLILVPYYSVAAHYSTPAASKRPDVTHNQDTATTNTKSSKAASTSTVTGGVIGYRSHPLENDCKYPLVQPDDANLLGVVYRPRDYACHKLQPSWSSQDAENGVIVLHDDVQTVGAEPHCYWRPIGGALRDKPNDVQWRAQWVPLRFNADHVLPAEQLVVRCYKQSANASASAAEQGDWFDTRHVYQRAYVQYNNSGSGNATPVRNAPRRQWPSAAADAHGLSVDIVVIDSTSLNQFRRHAAKTWKYMTEHMQFNWLQGYNKVADNSAVNLFPVLAGLRYMNQSGTMTSDIVDDKVVDLEGIDFIWNHMKDCVTMWNDDPMHQARGLFHYPWRRLKGWWRHPFDYYLRPWHVFNYKYLVKDDKEMRDPHCVAGEKYAAAHLELTERFISQHWDKCHFSFTFLTEMTHDDAAYLETMDDTLYNMLHRLHSEDKLNTSALVIMGDHGQRVSRIKHRYVGRIEERAPLFAVHVPHWWRRAHADLVRSLRANRHRLSSNYDVHQTLYQLATADWHNGTRHGDKGVTLLHGVHTHRLCADANVPPQHCLCMEPVNSTATDANLVQVATQLAKEHLGCMSASASGVPVSVRNATAYSISSAARDGVRDITEMHAFLDRNKTVFMDINYLEVQLTWNNARIDVKVLARLRCDMKLIEKALRQPSDAASELIKSALSLSGPILVQDCGDQCKHCLQQSRYVDDFCSCCTHLHRS